MNESVDTVTYTIKIVNEYHKNSRGLTREVVRAVELNDARIYECRTAALDYSVLPPTLSGFMEWCKDLYKKYDSRKD